jgi:isoleucyl-tRNA synthetase
MGEALVRLLAPVMSFTAEEVWGFLPPIPTRSESVHLELFPAPQDLTGEVPAAFDAAVLKRNWDALLGLRSEVLKVLEAARNEKRIGSSLEAQVRITLPEGAETYQGYSANYYYPLLEQYRDELRYLFIVSDVVLEKAPASNGDEGLRIEVSKAPGQKCERCWNYSIHVGEDKSYPTVCERCSAVLAEIEATAKA